MTIVVPKKIAILLDREKKIEDQDTWDQFVSITPLPTPPSTPPQTPALDFAEFYVPPSRQELIKAMMTMNTPIL